MYIGHYAVALALRKVDKNTSLGLLFLAVQLADIIFFPLVLLGVERFAIIENFTDSTHFELIYMPYSHSLFSTLMATTVVYFIIRFVLRQNKLTALVVGIAILSHWILDLIVHTPDLPLFADTSYKFGFGLWHSALATYILEMIILFAGFWIYLRSVKNINSFNKYGMIIFVLMLLLINAINIFGPLVNNSIEQFSITSFSLYLIFAAVAHWLDRKHVIIK